MKDLLIIPTESSAVTFEVRGSADTDGILILQHLYVLLFSSSSGYRTGTSALLFDLLDGGNLPPAGVLNARLAIACGSALSALDADERDLVESFTGEADDYGNMQLTLELKDGTVIQGVVNNE